jgi:hypothetical protein
VGKELVGDVAFRSFLFASLAHLGILSLSGDEPVNWAKSKIIKF